MSSSLRFQEASGLLLFFVFAWFGRAWLHGGPAIAAHAALALSLGWMLGERLYPHWKKGERVVAGLATWAGMLSLLLVAAYYASWSLRGPAPLLLEALLALGTLALPLPETHSQGDHPQKEERPHAWIAALLSILVSGAIVLLGRTAVLHQTTTSIRTPWPLLPEGGFLLLAIPLSAAIVAAILFRSRLAAAFATLGWASLASLPLLWYPLGYGFDGFIHRASQAVLQQTGFLHPKPFYYLGQYVWTTWLSQSFSFSLDAVDRWLLPMSVLFAGWTIAGLAGRLSKEHRFFAVALMLFLPLGAFVTTTPQSFAYVLGFSALILSLWPSLSKTEWVLPLILSAWAVASHPLGGLPFAAFVGARWIASWIQSRRLQAFILLLGTIAAIVIVPCAFWAQSRMAATPILWSWEWLSHLSWQDVLPSLLFQPRQTLTLWIDAAEWSTLLLGAFGVAVGAWAIIRPQAPEDRWLSATGLGLLIAKYMLERAATFTFLITYERGNYTERLAVLSALFLSIPAARWLSRRWHMLAERSGLLAGGMALLCISLWCLQAYNALPRHDAARASSGWSVGQADFAAVQWIHSRAAGKPYAVLANQTVSAAALQTYGFARYENDVFYYPLPTGGPLYQLFLEAASLEAASSTIQQAAALTASERVYVVINDYWWNAERVREHLASFSRMNLGFQEGRVWVYEFDASPASSTKSSLQIR